ncbi:multidrug effflux MFS transporter [Alteromonas oceanisediminis]|uniref:multidrug effflux MFS transporter n=1 Tax=Alteromonas oceanisediminis TaxID=2836180 RepID=UPI001BD98C76|nr:multidrug effflux MFS transporter [Alteromonas oceanisediminis]MBT0586213.1 multidrug effflux MFS transporter [Alteromonas oceanisediminis]
MSQSTLVKPALGIFEFVCLMALMTSLVALSIDAMLPAMNQIGADLGSDSQQQIHLIVSIFFIGMAFGQLFFGPFADARGRRETILVGLLVFAVGTVICMLSESMEVMLLGRLIQAFGVSGPRIAAMAVIRDQFVGESMARVMSFIMVVFILMPMLAPLVGQSVLIWFSWRHIFTLFLVVALIAGVWFFVRQPETLPKEKRKPFTWKVLYQSTRYILTHKAVMGYSIAMGCIFGAFLAYLSASQTIFQTIYQTGEQFPLIFALLAGSIGLASFFNGALVMRLGMHLLCHSALLCSIVFSLALLAVVFAYAGVPPLSVFVGTLFVGFFFIGVLFGNLNAMAMQPLGAMAGLGAAIIGSISSLLSVPVALIIDAYLIDNVYPIAIGFAVFCSLATVAARWATSTRMN